jgi:hypothetical protein
MIFAHPNPRAQALQERGAAALAGVMQLAALLALLFAFSDTRLFLLIGVALALLALMLPVLMLTAASPALEVTDDALILHPRVWRSRAVPWSAVRALKPHPLLPLPESESMRRTMVGRANYQPVCGVLIVIPSLPLPYRILGVFAGEGFTGAIALTSRTHADYDAALREIEARSGKAVEWEHKKN